MGDLEPGVCDLKWRLLTGFSCAFGKKEVDEPRLVVQKEVLSIETSLGRGLADEFLDAHKQGIGIVPDPGKISYGGDDQAGRAFHGCQCDDAAGKLLKQLIIPDDVDG